MAVITRKSQIITNADNGVKSTALIDRGNLYTTNGLVQIAADDSANSQYRFCRLPSQASINSILLYCDALTGGTSYSVGLYDAIDGGGPATNSNGNTTNSISLFAVGISLVNARVVPLELRFNNNVISTIGQTLAQLLGFTTSGARPYYDLVMTVVNPASVAGNIAMEVCYGGF